MRRTITLLITALSGFALAPAASAQTNACCAAGMQIGAPPISEVTWPMLPEAPRVRFLGSFTSEANLGRSDGALNRLRSFLTGTKRSLTPVERPYDVFVDATSRVYLTDGARRAVMIFDPVTRKARRLGEQGAGRLAKPMGLGGGARGQVFVADQSARRAVAFDANGHFLHAYGGEKVLLNPVDVAVDTTAGIVYVADSYVHQVLAFRESDGALIRRLGRHVDDLDAKLAALARYPVNNGHGEPPPRSPSEVAAVAQNARDEMGHDPSYNPEPRDLTKNRGARPGEFRFPSYVTVDATGLLYVTDAMNFRIQVFDRSGKFVRQIGRLGQVPGTFARPKGVAVDAEGHVYVVDAAFNNVQVFAPTGELLLPVGGMGRGPGELWLPLGIHIDARNRVYVADRYNNRIQIYEYLDETASRAVAAGARTP